MTADVIFVASNESAGSGISIFGFGQGWQEALARAIRAIPAKRRALLEASNDGFDIRGVRVGKGYALGDFDTLWYERLVRSDGDAAVAVWRDPAAYLTRRGLAGPVWMARCYTGQHGFPVHGFGRGAAEALEALLLVWTRDYARLSGLNPRYLHDRMRGRIEVRKVPPRRAAFVSRAIGDGRWTLMADDRRFEAVWERTAPPKRPRRQ